jgi:hypothetical protein
MKNLGNIPLLSFLVVIYKMLVKVGEVIYIGPFVS